LGSAREWRPGKGAGGAPITRWRAGGKRDRTIGRRSRPRLALRNGPGPVRRTGAHASGMGGARSANRRPRAPGTEPATRQANWLRPASYRFVPISPASTHFLSRAAASCSAPGTCPLDLGERLQGVLLLQGGPDSLLARPGGVCPRWTAHTVSGWPSRPSWRCSAPIILRWVECVRHRAPGPPARSGIRSPTHHSGPPCRTPARLTMSRLRVVEIGHEAELVLAPCRRHRRSRPRGRSRSVLADRRLAALCPEEIGEQPWHSRAGGHAEKRMRLSRWGVGREQLVDAERWNCARGRRCATFMERCSRGGGHVQT
jgi:hypothetical protein